jgi:D-alanine-D-alanine ligase
MTPSGEPEIVDCGGLSLETAARSRRGAEPIGRRDVRVLTLYNEPVLPDGHPAVESEREITYTADAVIATLAGAGIEVERLALGRDSRPLADAVRRFAPDVVFNLFEGLADDPTSEARAAELLERLGVPFTGSPSRSLRLAQDKPAAKRVLREAGVPTPDFFLVEGAGAPPCPLRFPVIVKPAREDASVGIGQESVVADERALAARAAWVVERYGAPALVEEFIGGRELQVSVIEAPELRALPVSEILFAASGNGGWPLVTYDAKWKPGSPEYETTPPRYPARIAPRLAREVQALALRAFRVLGCQDYARVDLRLGAGGEPFVLEVNPNPDLSPAAGLAGSLGTAGMTHAEFVIGLARAAAARARVRAR